MQARLRFTNGCIADLVANRVSPEFSRSLQVWSTEGCISANLHTREVVHHRPSSRLLQGELPFELAHQPGADIGALKSAVFGEFIEVERPALPEVDQLTAEIKSFVNCVPQRNCSGRRRLAGLRGVARRTVDSRRRCRPSMEREPCRSMRPLLAAYPSPPTCRLTAPLQAGGRRAGRPPPLAALDPPPGEGEFQWQGGHAFSGCHCWLVQQCVDLRGALRDPPPSSGRGRGRVSSCTPSGANATSPTTSCRSATPHAAHRTVARTAARSGATR